MIYLKQHLEKYPLSNWQDAVKLCYQASFGAEHILSDIDGARRFFHWEMKSIEAAEGELYEYISPHICRVDMGAWKAAGLDEEWLFKLFQLSSEPSEAGEELFLVGVRQIYSDFPQHKAEIDGYISGGIAPVHHSDLYKSAYCPHYRIIKAELLRIIPLLEYLKNHKARVIAIDGPAASGKTTLSSALSFVLSAEVVHMDDFFLPPELRSEKRLGEAGGNIHYERFSSEVLPGIISGNPFTYRVFDCSELAYISSRTVDPSVCCIVEGAYSHHPIFGDYADVRIFSQVNEKTQLERILKRNGEKMARLFEEKWIPMEKRYFEEFSISDKADLLI